MSEHDSLKDFLRDALDDHDAGASQSDMPTSIAAAPVKKSEMGMLPGHQVQGFIARGGMGAIYLARQQALEREVAVKVMTRDAGSAEMAERFRREALVLGRLAHPNIVPVYDIGTDDEGQLFYTMKLVKGRTLQHILNDLRTEDAAALKEHTLASLLTVFRKVCDALAFAHSQGIIHRDLKPENVMVGEFGEVLVMDWGLAKQLRISDCGWRIGKTHAPGSDQTERRNPQSEIGATLDGSVMGTPQYMSPEQARGEIDELDARSDIFSLGGILYAILTLRPPVEGTTLQEVLDKVRTGAIAAPTALATSTSAKSGRTTKGSVLEAKKITPLPHIADGRVPAALSAVVMKALRLAIEQRYQCVEELIADIEKYQGGFATKAEEAGLARHLALLVRRNAKMFALAAAAAVIIVSITVWAFFNLRLKERRAVAGERAAVEEKNATRQALAKSSLSVAEGWLRDGDAAQMQMALEGVPEDLRDSTWRYLRSQSDTSVTCLKGLHGQIEWVVPHPKVPGVFVTAEHSGHVCVRRASDGKAIGEFKAALGKDQEIKGLNLTIAVSPDAEKVAVGTRQSQGGIVIHRLSDGRLLSTFEGAETGESLCFSPDGRRLLQSNGVGVKNRSITIWDVFSGRGLWSRRHEGAGFIFGAFTPQGDVLVAEAALPLRLVKAGDGRLIRDVGDAQSFTGLAVRGDGVFAVQDSHLRVSIGSLSDGRLLTRFKPEVPSTSTPLLLWSPDGEQLITAWSNPGGGQTIQLRHYFTGSLLRSLLGGVQRFNCAAIHPLSGEFVTCGTEVRVWQVTGARTLWTQTLGGVGVEFLGGDDVVFSFAANERSCGVHKWRTGGLDPLWVPAGTHYKQAAGSGDGNTIALMPNEEGHPTLVLRRYGDEVREVCSVKTKLAHVGTPRLSPTGARLALFGSTVETFDVATGGRLTQLEIPDAKQISGLGWTSEKQLVGIVTVNAMRRMPRSEERIVVWDAESGRVVRSVANPSIMNVLAVARDGGCIAEAGPDKIIRIRDAATLAVVQEFRAHDGPVTALAWHPRLPVLASASEDHAIRLWDINTHRMIEELRGPLNHPSQKLTFSPSGRLLACATAQDLVRIWEPVSLKVGSAEE